MPTDLPQPTPAMTQPAAKTPELAFLNPHLNLQWGEGRDIAVARLAAAFGSSVSLQSVQLPGGRHMEMGTLVGSVQGFPQTTIQAFFTDGRLMGVEVVIPPQGDSGASDLFKTVYFRQLRGSSEWLYNTGFILRRAQQTEVEINGPVMCKPETIDRWLNAETRRQVDQGSLKAEGFVLFKSGGLLQMQTPSAGLEAKNPLYRLGSLIVGIRAFDPAMIQTAEAEAANERRDGRERSRVHRSDVEEEDYETPAFKQLRARAVGGDRAAQKALAILYMKGDDIPSDRAEAIKWCEKALAQGDTSLLFPLATLYANAWYTFWSPFPVFDPTTADYARAAVLYERAGQAGNARALVRLAGLYASGRGVKQDAAAAKRLMERAASLGDPDAYYALMELEAPQSRFYTGQALRFAQEAARHGHVLAAWNLAYQCESPEVGQPRYDEAAKWLEMAAYGFQAYDPNIMLNARARLSDLYAEGLGVKRDRVEALKWKLLARAGYSDDMKGAFEAALARLREGMEPAAIAEAEHRARTWLEGHPKVENRLYPFE